MEKYYENDITVGIQLVHFNEVEDKRVNETCKIHHRVKKRNGKVCLQLCVVKFRSFVFLIDLKNIGV